MSNQILIWVLFNVFVLTMLFLDLAVFHRRSHEVKIKEALLWSAVWITIALIFNVIVYFWQGTDHALKFLTGYLIEKSLSVDNLFVFIMIFSYFAVDAKYQHKVLFWGILGALIMRAIFILTGVVLINKFHWVIYIFGVFLIFTGIKMAKKHGPEVRPEKNPLLKLLRKFLPVTKTFENDRFLVKKSGKVYATPLLVVLVVVESTDLIFAVDSIPAILAVTTDPFIVYSSNVFAILGLRALYFALAGFIQKFRFLHYALATMLIFVGIKMLIADIYKIPIAIALGAVAGIMLASILASIFIPEEKSKKIETI